MSTVKDTLALDVAADIHQETFGKDGQLLFVWQEDTDPESESNVAAYVQGKHVPVKR